MTFSTIAFLVLGLVLLIWGAEYLVRGASNLATAAGVSPLVVGLTVVAFGTSSPELAVSVMSAFKGQADLALGNVVGSNIFNVLFILGLSAMIVPLVVAQQLVRFDVPVMIFVSFLLLGLGFDGNIGRLDGILLFGGAVAYTVFLIRQSRKESSAEVKEEYEKEFSGDKKSGVGKNIAFVVVGLAGLMLGSKWLVSSAITIAQSFGVSELVIGLTIVAAGTSMPEVAASITAAFKGERDIAVGNVVGSNTFNIFGCVGLSALASGSGGLSMAASVMSFDIWVMLAVALACLPVFMSNREIARWEGGVFLGYYVAYVAYLILAAQQHAALQAFSGVMMSFVVPITIITLVVAMFGSRSKPADPG
jgi:cation:H+ antiporter